MDGSIDHGAILSGVSTVISAAGVIIMAWWKTNQKNRDKLTDLKIEQWKSKEKETNFRTVENSAKIYGILWEVLYVTKCDRVYILQPHPTHNHQYVTITMEVKRKGVSGMKGQIKDMAMGDVAYFVKELVSSEYSQYDLFEENDLDRKIKAIMNMNGTTQVAIHKLTNVHGDWIGSIFAESANQIYFDKNEMKQIIKEAANSIQYILPGFTN